MKTHCISGTYCLFAMLAVAFLLSGCAHVFGGMGEGSARIVAISATSIPAAVATVTPSAQMPLSEIPMVDAVQEGKPLAQGDTNATVQGTEEEMKAPTEVGIAVRIRKEARTLELWKEGELVHTCGIGLGFDPLGHKEREGDGRTPEGPYYACTRNDQSRYYLSIGLSYPNVEDAAYALEKGSITQAQHDDIAQAIDSGRRPPWDTPLGGEIMIHGRGGTSDWTAGCVAVDDEDMDILWEHVSIGTPIWVLP